MKPTNYFNINVPELGDRPNITQVSDAIGALEDALAGTAEYMDGTVSEGKLTLSSQTRSTKRTGYHDGLTLLFTAKQNIPSGGITRVVVDGLGEQDASLTYDIVNGDTVMATYEGSSFKFKYMPIPRSNSITSDSTTNVATSKAVKDVNDRVNSAFDVAEELNRKMEVLNGQIGELEETSVKTPKGENILLFRNGEYLTYKDNSNKDRLLAMINTFIGVGSINSRIGGSANIEIKSGHFLKPSTNAGTIYYDRAFANGCFAVILLAEGSSLAPTDSHIILTSKPAHAFDWKAQNNYNYVVNWIAIGH